MASVVVVFIALITTNLHFCRAERDFENELGEMDVDDEALSLARTILSSSARGSGPLSGKTISCEEGALKGSAHTFGDELGRGAQATIYEVGVNGSMGSIVAKVEHTSSNYHFDLEECGRNQQLVAAGINAPQCYGQCMYGSQHVLLFQQIHGSPLLVKEKDDSISLGSTIAKLDCDELKQVLEQGADAIAGMINAGFANADQHAANVMFDEDGQIWLIDHSLKFAAKREVNDSDWQNIMGRMVGIYPKYAKIIPGTAGCEDRLEIELIERILRAITDKTDKTPVCQKSSCKFAACKGLCPKSTIGRPRRK